ncbi:MAG: Rho-binding antiterminator [Saprospiraceae bacterium]|jgi:Rho-binding antiterminator
MEKEKYTPIACQFYDVLEMHASRKEEVTISYFESGESVKIVHSKIDTLVTRNKEEFLVLPDDTEIRLDQILSVNDTQFYGACGF